MPNGWSLEPGEKDPTMKIIAGVVAVGAIALGVVFATRGDDEKSGGTSKPPATTVVAGATTTGPLLTTTSSTAAATTTTSSPAGTTVPTGPITGEDLVAAMPTSAELPQEWTQYADPDANPVAGDGAYYCDQTDEVTRAGQAGGVAAFGPRYDLPAGGWFGFDVFAFTSDEAATAFMRQAGDDANLCSNTPITYTETEGDVSLLNEEFSDDTVWNVREASAGVIGNIVNAEGMLRVTVEFEYSTQANGKSLKVRSTIYIVYEQHGKLVTEFWVGGNWNFQGMGTAQPAMAHQPVVAELDAAVEAAREPMLTRLEAAGVV